MKKICEFILETESRSDFDNILASPKNRSSFATIDEGIQAGNNKFAAEIGEKRVKHWAGFLADHEFSNMASLPVWDNGDGTYTLGDGHTRIAAIKLMIKSNKGYIPPFVTLEIKNYKYNDNYEDFVSDTAKLNTFSGYKWDVWDKLDYMAKEGNANALYVEELFGNLYDKFLGHKVPINMVLNILLDTQGTTKVGEIEKNMAKVKSFNPYVDNFFETIHIINNAIVTSKLPEFKQIDILKEKILQTLYNIYMCAVWCDKVNEYNDATNAFISWMKYVFATSAGNAFNHIDTRTQATAVLDFLMESANTILGKQKSFKYSKGLQDLIINVNMVKGGKRNGGMANIGNRGGRVVTFKN